MVGVSFCEFVTDVVGFPIFRGGGGEFLPWSKEVSAPVGWFDVFDWGRQPGARGIEVGSEQGHECAHGVVAFVLGIYGWRELEEFVRHPRHTV